jgi:hypothetical protein
MSADLMRSRLSRTAVSGMPTMTKSRAEPDAYMSTSTSIRVRVDAIDGGAAGFE